MTLRTRKLRVALACLALAALGAGSAYALTVSTVVSVCATTPAQTIAANGKAVGVIAAVSKCVTTTVPASTITTTVPGPTTTVTTTVPGPTTTVTTTVPTTTTTPPPPPPTTTTTPAPPPPGACTTTLSGGDLALALEKAAAGSTLCLSSGAYTFKGSMPFGPTAPGLFLTQPASDVNIVPLPGASVTVAHMTLGTVAHLNFDGTAGRLAIAGMDNDSGDGTSPADSSNHLTFRNVVWTDGVTVRVHGSAQAILIDHDTFANLSGGPYEGRLSVRGYAGAGEPAAASGVIVSNSTFTGNGGCSDGVQIIGGAYGVAILSNEFSGILQGSCAAHSDAIQLYGSSHTLIQGNYVHDDSTGIMAPDGGDHEAVTQNVFVRIGAQSLQFAAHVGTVIQHNTFAGTTSSAGWCGNKPGVPNSDSSGCVVRDNVFTTNVNPGTPGGNAEDHNLCAVGDTNCAAPSDVHGTPVYAEGASPTTRAGYVLAPGSPGKGAASDGADIGITG